MKYLYLVRHAKSSWDHPGLNDFDRPLNERGIRDAPKMGEYLATQDILPQAIISSTANRARQTALALATSMRIPSANISENGQIYAASVTSLISVVQTWDDEQETIMMVGHNPGIAELAAILTDEHMADVPTCTVIAIELNVKRWCDVMPACGTHIFRISASMLMNS